MLATSSNSYQKAGEDSAVALLRGAAAKASAAADAANADATADRGPATRTSLSPAAQAVSVLRTSLNALQPALNEDVAGALFDQLQKTSDTLTKLDQAKQGMIGDRKAAAEQKLELARKKLALLRALGGDPKTIARQAKAIAQEIKAAAIEFGEALKAAGGSGTAAPVPVTEAVADPTDPAAADGNTSVASPEAAASAETPEAAPEDDSATPPNSAVQTADEAKEGEHDREVLEAFKDAAREVRRMMEEAARKLKARHDPDANGSAQKAGAIDKAIGGLAAILGISQSGGADRSTAITDIVAAAAIDIRV